MKTISNKQLERYPVYLKLLQSFADQGWLRVSAPQIAEALNLNPEQVRKDLAAITTEEGKPRSGRELANLIDDLEKFLGYTDTSSSILIGVGHLGEAFLHYRGFSDLGLEIVAGFDNDPKKYGRKVNGKEVFPIELLETMIPRLRVSIAILTLPQETAQAITDRLVDLGIRAIWNFAPIHLHVPSDIVVQNVNLASSLAILSHQLTNYEKESN